MVQRFRNFSLLFYLRNHRRTILMSPLSRTAIDNRSFVFDGNREQNRSSPGNSKNCSKESGFHVGKQAETFVPSSRQRFLIGRPILISFYGNGGTKFRSSRRATAQTSLHCFARFACFSSHAYCCLAVALWKEIFSPFSSYSLKTRFIKFRKSSSIFSFFANRSHIVSL
jgi:hypothetical protein